jgi:hypothetical protein
VSERNHQAGIDGGKVVIALGALLLLVSLFLNWYGFGRGPDGDGFSAWTAFELTDLILAVLAIAAIAAAVEPFVRATPRLPERTGAIAGPIALILVAASLINEPPAAQGFDATIEIGAWLALAGAAIMCAGGLLAFNRISLVVTPRERTGETRVHETETRTLPADPKA